MGEGKEPPPPWKELLYDFTQETTLHGIRFTTISTHLIRRAIWILCVLGSSAALLYFICSNLIRYYDYNKTVNVEVSYEDELDFPAATICNQNIFRLTGVFEAGMYDALSQHFSPNHDNSTCRDTYTWQKTFCPDWSALETNTTSEYSRPFTYITVSLQACELLCAQVHSSTCRGILYDRKDKNCLLSSYDLQSKEIASTDSCIQSRYEFYERHQCSGEGKEMMTCDFEDIACDLIWAAQGDESWERIHAGELTQNSLDHTFASPHGHLLAIPKSVNRQLFKSKIIFPNRFYSGMCLELFYLQLTGNRNPSLVNFKVNRYLADRSEHVLYNTQEKDMDVFSWNRVLINLPDGTYDLLIEVERPVLSSTFTPSGLAFDDISVWPCQRYKRDCLHHGGVMNYNGLKEISRHGERCELWRDVFEEYDFDTNDTDVMTARQDFSISAGRACRVPPVNLQLPDFYSGPWCFVKKSFGIYVDMCDINHCPCRIGQFRCETSGLCIPESLTCDGKADCNDHSDEFFDICGRFESIECSFDDSFLCGYVIDQSFPAKWRAKQATDQLNEPVDIATDREQSTLGYIMDIDGSKSDEGEEAVLMTPEITIDASGSCLRYSTHMHYHRLDTEQVLKISTKDTNWNEQLIAEVRNEEQEFWVEYENPLPLGTYRIEFRATMGFPYSSDISLDAIALVPCQQSVRKKRDVNVEIQESIDCTFDEQNICGYKLDSTNAKLKFKMIPAHLLVEEAEITGASQQKDCVKVLRMPDGIIESDNFPQLYRRTNCTYVIEGGVGSEIILTIAKMDVGKKEADGNCSSDHIMLKGAEFNSSSDKSLVIDPEGLLCGQVGDIQFRSTGNQLSLTFYAEKLSEKHLGFRAKYKIISPEAKTGEDMLLMADFHGLSSSNRASLISPDLHNTERESCLLFLAYAQQVRVYHVDAYWKREIAGTNAGLSNMWHKVRVGIPAGSRKFVISVSSPTYVAIDNITLIPDDCSAADSGALNLDKGEILNCTDPSSPECSIVDASAGYTFWVLGDALEHDDKPEFDYYGEYDYSEGYVDDYGNDYERGYFSGNDDYPDQSSGSGTNYGSGNSYGYGYDYGNYHYDYYGSGSGSGTGSGSGSDFGSGSGSGSGHGYDYGYGYGSGEVDESPARRKRDIKDENVTVGNTDSRILDAILPKNYPDEDELNDVPASYADGTVGKGKKIEQYDFRYNDSTVIQHKRGELRRVGGGRSNRYRRAAVESSPNAKMKTGTTDYIIFKDYQISIRTCGFYRALVLWTASVFVCEGDDLTTGSCSLKTPLLVSSTSSCFSMEFRASNHFKIFLIELDSEHNTRKTLSYADYLIDTTPWNKKTMAFNIPYGNITVMLETEVPDPSVTRIEMSNLLITPSNCSSSDYDYFDGSDENVDTSYNFMVGDTLQDVATSSKYENTTGNDRIVLINDVASSYRPFAKQMDVKELLLKSAHKKNDFIYRCMWKNVPCSDDDFVMEITDFGVCYTFNADKNKVKSTDVTGARTGLSLVINIEQYDHTRGANSDAGVKLHLHDQDDISTISDTGIAIAMSTHTLIEITYSKSKSLPDPYGKCASLDLEYFPNDNYTYARCQRQTQTMQLIDSCKCKDANMPGNAPVCSMNNFMDCVLPFYEGKRPRNYDLATKCPDACEVVNYEVQTSFATLSSLSDDQFLYDADQVATLTNKFYHAREVDARANHPIVHTVERIEGIIRTVDVLLNLANVHNPTKKGSFYDVAKHFIIKAVRVVRTDVKDVMGNLFRVLRKDFNTSYGKVISLFTQTTGALSATMYEYVTFAVFHLKNDINATTLEEFQYMQKYHLEVFFLELTERETALRDDDIMLRYLRTILNWAPKRFFINCMKAQRNVVKNAEKFKAESENIFLNKTVGNGDYVSRISRQKLRELSQIYSEYESNKEITSKCHNSYLEKIDQIETWFNEDSYVSGMTDDILSSFTTTFNMEEHIQDLLLGRSKLRRAIDDFSHDKVKMRDLSRVLDESEGGRIAKMAKDLKDIIDKKLYNNVLLTMKNVKTDMIATYKKTLDHLREIHNYHKPSPPDVDLETKARKMKIWNMPYIKANSPSTLRYRYKAGETAHLWVPTRDITSFTKGHGATTALRYVITMFFEEADDQIARFYQSITNLNEQLEEETEKLTQHLNAFHQRTTFDQNFVLENFLKLDVYYGELKYVFVEQHVAYSASDFFSDMGGYMGLLLGASVLTIVEVLDLLLYQTALKFRNRTERRSKVSSATSSRIVVTPLGEKRHDV